jgi:hypothetical protein
MARVPRVPGLFGLGCLRRWFALDCLPCLIGEYLVSVITDTVYLADPDEEAAMDVFNERLQADGHWVFAGGLAGPSSATVIDNRGEEAMVTDGPFVESKEFLIGFWIIEAADLDVALKLGTEGSKACDRKIEVRPFL